MYKKTYEKTGIIVQDFDALRKNTKSYEIFVKAVLALQPQGLIILSLASILAPSAAFRIRHKTSFVTDINALSPTRIFRLCDAVYYFENNKIKQKDAPASCQLVPHQNAARVGLFVSNGHGLGHVARMRSLAAELAPHATCAFFSLSAGLVDQSYYLPSPQYLEIHDKHQERAYMHEAVLRFINLFAPTHMVYDGNILPPGLLSALSLHPHIHLTWLRRGMWPQNIAPLYMMPQALCDLVIEPGDVADSADTGPSWHTRLNYCPANQFLKTAPIRPLSNPPLNTDAAKQALSLRPDTPYVLLMLGATQNLENLNTLKSVCAALAGRYIPVIAHWPMSHSRPPQIKGAITIEQMPLAPYYNAFDIIMSAAGYNSYHELLSTNRPLIFIPQEGKTRDQQLARSQYAEKNGWAALCRRHELERLPQILDNLTPQPRPNIAFHTDTGALLGALNITPNMGGHYTLPKNEILNLRTLKALHRRHKGIKTNTRFVLTHDAKALKKLDNTRDIILTHTIPPVELRRAGFKYLWLNPQSHYAQMRSFKIWLSIWNPKQIISV